VLPLQLLRAPTCELQDALTPEECMVEQTDLEAAM
jgi:hypothetical protein